jgi:hypothetical protein
MLTKSLELKKLVVLINLLIVNVIFTNLFFARDNFCNSYIYLFYYNPKKLHHNIILLNAYIK